MKVLLVDDHVLFREGLSLLLKSLLENVEIYEAGTVSDAMSQVSSNDGIELILLDLGLPDVSGTEGVAMMRERYPEIPVVALSSSEDKATVLGALDRGAMGFVPKSSSASVLTGAIRLILAHGVYLPPSVFLGDRHPATTSTIDTGERSRRSSTQDSQRMMTPADLGLTSRQAEVLLRILQGKPAKVIARELNLSAGTVKTHTSVVLRALNVTTRTQAVIAAGKLGLCF
ncbi:MAG TPA: response regulator transcription factor [Steroidobacteraceae bacterium]|nr:response regulator transcription factor [Steroidobacteraceae bacterium]